ncbi:hypothetical protein DBR42_11885, partial [Pelomonas sp. HMWF004]
MATGVRIVDDPSPAGDGMPVMDVPVFIGFAARGPVHRPVALDSAAAYTDVFGGLLDLVQAGDDAAERLVAHLPAAVAAFFAGGGRRCHVIRVAAATASAAHFNVPGLRLYTRSGGSWQAAGSDFELRANSPGDWADRLALSARVRSQALHAGDAVHAGDLLRTSHPDHPGEIGWQRVGMAGLLNPSPKAADWLWPAGGAAPGSVDGWLFERVQVDLALRAPGQPLQQLEACGLAASAARLPWWAPDADALYDAGTDLTGWPLAGLSSSAGSDEWLLLPTGMSHAFEHW